MCSLLVHMAIRSEAKLQGLILQQQPACLLTALWAFCCTDAPRPFLLAPVSTVRLSVRLCPSHARHAS